MTTVAIILVIMHVFCLISFAKETDRTQAALHAVLHGILLFFWGFQLGAGL